MWEDQQEKMDDVCFIVNMDLINVRSYVTCRPHYVILHVTYSLF